MSYLLEVRAVISALFILGASVARSGDTVEPARAEIEAQIQRLNSEEFETRENALSALRRMGAEVLAPAKAAYEAAGNENPELSVRLEALIYGPRVRQFNATGWVKALKANSYEDRMEAVTALEAMGLDALPQIETIALDNDPFLKHTGLWLLSRLGDKAKAAAPCVRKLLASEMEYIDAHELSFDKEADGWALYLHPRSQELGDPPVVDYHLGEKDGDAYSYPYDIMARIESVTYERRRTCVVRPWSDFCKAYEGSANLRGAMIAYAFCPQDRCDVMKVLPSLSLKLLCHTLERVGPGGEGEVLIKHAQLKIVELMSREMGRP